MSPSPLIPDESAQFNPGRRVTPWYHRRVVVYACLLACAYLAWCKVLYFRQDRLIFPHDMAGHPPKGRLAPRGVEQIFLEPQPGIRVEAWYLRGEGAGGAAPRPAVIYCHANAEIIDDHLEYARKIASWGVSVLLPEYRGYGLSNGKPSQRDIVSDLLQFHALLAARPEVDRTRIIYHGRSLGGGAAAALAERLPPNALILESTFTNLASYAHRYGVPEFLCKHPFYTDRVLPKLHCPILILHGKRDDLIPVAHGRRLHELAPGSQYAEFDAGHNDFPGNWNAYWTSIREFLSRNGFLTGSLSR